MTKLMQYILILIAFVMIGCVGDDGGTTNGSCNFEACGGDIVGNWDIVDVCFNDTEQLTDEVIDEPECSDFLQDIDIEADGGFIFDRNGSGEGEYSMVINSDFLVSDRCMQAISGVNMTPYAYPDRPPLCSIFTPLVKISSLRASLECL